MFLILKGNWPSDSFRRSIRDDKGKIVKTYIFTKDEPVEIEKSHFEVIKQAIGHSLVVAEVDGKGRFREDHEATQHVLEKGTMPRKKKKPYSQPKKPEQKTSDEKNGETQDESEALDPKNFDPSDLDRADSDPKTEAKKPSKKK